MAGIIPFGNHEERNEFLLTNKDEFLSLTPGEHTFIAWNSTENDSEEMFRLYKKDGVIHFDTNMPLSAAAEKFVEAIKESIRLLERQ
jgi:hypothetical protein